jgi:hypothetical protein
MKRSSLVLLLALACLPPSAAWAKGKSKSNNSGQTEKKGGAAPTMSPKQAQELAKCMQKCQEPAMACMEGCKGNQSCATKCSTRLTDCATRTCGDLLPEAEE